MFKALSELSLILYYQNFNKAELYMNHVIDLRANATQYIATAPEQSINLLL